MFKAKPGELPVGMQPVMIGRRARRYNTVDKAMARLNRVFDILTFMERLNVRVENIHCDFFN